MNSTFSFKDVEDKIDYVKSFKIAIDNYNKQEVDLKNKDKFIDSKVYNILYQTEYSFLLNELIFETKFIIKYFEEVPDKIRKFNEDLNNSMYTRKFVLVNEKIEEIENGYLENKKEELLESPQFKQLQQMLENSSQL